MKKLLCTLCFFAVLAGCSNKPLVNDFADYQGKTAADIFNSGEMSLAKEKFKDAVTDFEALDALYPFGTYAEQGLVDSIYAYHQTDDDPSALAAADRYLRLYPRGKHVDYVLYIQGLIQFEQGATWMQQKFKVDSATRDLTNKKLAFAAFDQLIKMYPHSDYAYAASLKMHIIRNMFARKELAIASFYLERHAYIAAANRASEVVAHYSGTPSVESALVVMAQSYDALRLKAYYDDTLRILQANYPDAVAKNNLS